MSAKPFLRRSAPCRFPFVQNDDRAPQPTCTVTTRALRRSARQRAPAPAPLALPPHPSTARVDTPHPLPAHRARPDSWHPCLHTTHRVPCTHDMHRPHPRTTPQRATTHSCSRAPCPTPRTPGNAHPACALRHSPFVAAPTLPVRVPLTAPPHRRALQPPRPSPRSHRAPPSRPLLHPLQAQTRARLGVCAVL